MVEKGGALRCPACNRLMHSWGHTGLCDRCGSPVDEPTPRGRPALVYKLCTCTDCEARRAR